MLQRVIVEAIGRQGLLLKREYVDALDIRDIHFSHFFREILENVGLDSTYFVVNVVFVSGKRERACVFGHYIVSNAMLIPISANGYRTLWEFEV